MNETIFNYRNMYGFFLRQAHNSDEVRACRGGHHSTIQRGYDMQSNFRVSIAMY